MDYDARNEHSDEEYSAFIRWLSDRTAASLVEARGSTEAVTVAVIAYLERGYQAYLSAGELVDFFCVSTPSILDDAGYSELDQDDAVRIYDEVHPKIFARYYPEST